MEEIQEDPKRDALIDALMEELREYIRSIIHETRNHHQDMARTLIIVHESGIKDRLKEILDHERDRVKV